ncbi:MAG: replicative DNA helicase [Alphaproteobacteria bacterium]|nr:replicative DNA helicase [Alphaproteobacteria bacterium]
MNARAPDDPRLAEEPSFEAPPDNDPTYRQLPANLEVEMALLGSILVDNRIFEQVSDFLEADHFFDASHQRIYDAIRRVTERGGQASPDTLRDYFQQQDRLADVGGPRYLAEIAASAIGVIDPKYYGQAIHDLHLRRALVSIGGEVVNEAYDSDLELTAAGRIERAEHRLFELATTGAEQKGFQPFVRTLDSTIAMAESAFRRDGGLTGVTTGFSDLNKILGGLQNSDLVVLAGRPGMGKTALATNIAFNAAQARERERDDFGEMQEIDGYAVAFFSLEMSAEQLALRILGEQAKVSSDEIRRGRINQAQFDDVLRASRTLETLKLFIDDTPAITVSQLRTRARRLLRTQDRLDLIVVDYIQLMQPGAGRRPENRVQEVSEITRGLKAVAKELNLPILALSQLSRAVEQRENKRPQLSDLRESGSIEQDADVVMFIYREEYYLALQEPPAGTDKHMEWMDEMHRVANLAEAIIAKHRHGPTGKVDLFFEGRFTRFADLEKHRDEESPD